MAIQDFLDKCPSQVTLLSNVQINWSDPGVGFGQLYFYNDEAGKLRCSNEGMGRAFIKRMLGIMVDNCVLDGE